MKFVIFCIAIYWSFIQAVFAQSVGFQQFKIGDNNQRPINITLWYPSVSTQPTELVAENRAFYGTSVVRNGAINANKYPLVLLSHGYRGSWRNLNWLAYQLSQQGMIVAAVDHPGTTTFNTNPIMAAQWWQRPNDLVNALDFLLADKHWRDVINRQRISAIGHSLGGWSVMQLAGAEFNRQQFLDQCQLYPNPRTCGLAKELGIDKPQVEEPSSGYFFDERVSKIVILDLGLARSLSVSSLNKVKTPILILAAGIDIGDLPQSQESGFLAEHIPLIQRRYQVYEQAMHFSFMQLCKKNAVNLLDSEVPGDGIICKDGSNTTRSEIHQKIVGDVSVFLAP